MLPALLILVPAALLGLAFGSFLNVCIVRLPEGLSVVSPRSRCNRCGSPIAVRDNIPIVSFLLLRGQCRGCSEPIGIQYPLVEAFTSAWFLVSALPVLPLLLGGNVDGLLAAIVHAASTATLGVLLIGIAVMDWQTQLLPDEFTLGGLGLGLFFAFAESFFVLPVPYKTFFTPEEALIGGRLGAAVAGFLLLWSIRVLYKRVRGRAGMGPGDAKLAAMLGMFLGFGPLAVTLFTGILLAAMFGVGLLLTRKGTGNTRVPFGSFLAVGGLFAAVWGEAVVHWYLALFV